MAGTEGNQALQLLFLSSRGGEVCEGRRSSPYNETLLFRCVLGLG